jgi:small GTP-binding protein
MIDQELPRKVILLGNSGVGKTSLFNRWTNNAFEPSPHPTIGASNTFKAVELDQRVVKITLWDTAGQEQFRSITPLYIRGAKCAILVTEPTVESFESLHGWIRMLRETLSERIGTVRAVTKAAGKDPWDDSELTALIEANRQSFTGVFAVSAKTGTNVDLLFQEAARVADAAGSRTACDSFDVGGADAARFKCC